MTICIISNINDAHAICVEAALQRKGQNVFAWHWSDFPSNHKLTFAVDQQALCLPLPIRQAQGGTVWVHRGLAPLPGRNLHPSDRLFAKHESFTMLDGLMMELANTSFFVNPVHAVRNLRSKINQLALARNCDLAIAPTLYSNDPEVIRTFYHQHHGQVIVKHSSQMFWESDKKTFMAYAARITAEHLRDDVQLAACPAIFQLELKKHFELRVVFFGATLFCIKIVPKAQQTLDSRDWSKGRPEYEVFDLPAGEEQKLRTFIRATGLVYGSIDVAVTSQGEFVFLEINETGQFLWIEDFLPQLPLLDCFCELLISKNPAFQYRSARQAVRVAEFDPLLAPSAIEQRSRGHVLPVDVACLAE